MAQIFSARVNFLFRNAILLIPFSCGAAVFAWSEWLRSDYVTRTHYPIEQPVPFSHRHHVGDVGLDCRYCHASVEDSPFAGMPPTETCMTCHSQLWTGAPALGPVRASLATGQPLRWTRVYDLPDFVYFDHSIHVAKGIGCTSCHGPIGEMAFTEQHQTPWMKWCLDCHRNPERHVRPKGEVFNPDYKAPAGQLELGKRLVREYHIENKTDCSVCHR